MQLLPGVLPDEQGSAHVDVERAGDALLWDLHAHVQLLDQTGGDSFTLVSGGKGEDWLLSLNNRYFLRH